MIIISLLIYLCLLYLGISLPIFILIAILLLLIFLYTLKNYYQSLILKISAILLLILLFYYFIKVNNNIDQSFMLPFFNLKKLRIIAFLSTIFRLIKSYSINFITISLLVWLLLLNFGISFPLPLLTLFGALVFLLYHCIIFIIETFQDIKDKCGEESSIFILMLTWYLFIRIVPVLTIEANIYKAILFCIYLIACFYIEGFAYIFLNTFNFSPFNFSPIPLRTSAG